MLCCPLLSRVMHTPPSPPPSRSFEIHAASEAPAGSASHGRTDASRMAPSDSREMLVKSPTQRRRWMLPLCLGRAPDEERGRLPGWATGGLLRVATAESRQDAAAAAFAAMPQAPAPIDRREAFPLEALPVRHGAPAQDAPPLRRPRSFALGLVRAKRHRPDAAPH